MTGAGNYTFVLDVRDYLDTSLIPSPNTLTNLGDSCAGGAGGKADAGNQSDRAAGIAPNIFIPAACQGTLGVTSGDTVDWYKFPAPARQMATLVVGTDGVLPGVGVTIYRSDATTAVKSVQASAVPGTPHGKANMT